MKLTYKYTIVSILATSADFSVFHFLENFKIPFHAISTFIGMLIGAIVSWTLHRYWVFIQSTQTEFQKRSKYAIGFFLCIALNVAFMAICADFFEMQRMPSRVFTSCLVWGIIFWFNKKIVFKV